MTTRALLGLLARPVLTLLPSFLARGVSSSLAGVDPANAVSEVSVGPSAVADSDDAPAGAVSVVSMAGSGAGVGTRLGGVGTGTSMGSGARFHFMTLTTPYAVPAIRLTTAPTLKVRRTVRTNCVIILRRLLDGSRPACHHRG